MTDREDFPPFSGDPSSSSSGCGGGGRFRIPQPNRDLQSNWELDLARNLEGYALAPRVGPGVRPEGGVLVLAGPARVGVLVSEEVNNGTVDLQREASSSELVCYSAANPFYVKLLHNERRKEMGICSSSRKRVKSQPKNAYNSKANRSSSEATSPLKSLHQNGRLHAKMGKGTVIRCTPEGKRRRKSRMNEAADLQAAG